MFVPVTTPWRSLAGAAALLLCACSELPTNAGGRIPHIRTAVIEPAPSDLARYVSVTLDSAARVQIEYWAPGEQKLMVATSSAAEQHHVLLPRLLSSTAYQYRAYPVDGSGTLGASMAGTFLTGPLPAGLIDLQTMSTGRPTYPLTMLEVSQQPSFAGFVVVDERGRVVWYRRATGGATGTARRRNGNFVFLDGAGLTEVAPDGQELANLARAGDGQGFHHDVIVSLQNTVYAIAKEPRTYEGEVRSGEAIWEWDPDLGIAVKRWSAFDFLPPSTDRGPRSRATDWLHANSLAIGPRGNVLISLPFLNQVVSIRADFTDLEWRLGGYGGNIVVEGEGTFSGEHTASEVAPGHVLMFDNGWDRGVTPNYSRGLELELDLANKTARPVWSFRAPSGNYSGAISSARRLPNGNTLVQFGLGAGVVNSSGPVEAYEVTAAGDILWHLRFENLQVSYRATPLPDLAGEFEVGSTQP